MSHKSKTSLRLTFTGDLALAGEFVRKACPPGKALTFPFEPTADQLGDTEVLIVNFEGPIGTKGRVRQGRPVLVHNDIEVLDWLATFPCCVCCLANNHIMDYGAEALIRTKHLLAERGIHSVGAGIDEAEAARELRLTISGFTLGILAFTTDERHVGSLVAGPGVPGACGLPDENVLCDRVSKLAREVDAVIVVLHWGYEYFHYPTPSQMSLCRKVASMGATLVVGHHPHVQQGLEELGASLISYSLGNLILPEMRTTTGRLQYRKPATKQYAILEAEISKHRVRTWRISGGYCDKRYNLVPYSGKTALRFNSEIKALSHQLASEHYIDFYRIYAEKRRRALEREGFRDSAAKLLKTDLTTLWKTFSLADIGRNARKLFALASYQHKQDE